MSKLALGLMSGTSGDGVSLALASFNKDHSFKLLDYQTVPFPFSLAKVIQDGPNLKAPEISRLNIVLGEFFAKAAVKFLRRRKVFVIGSHGQTIYHGPKDSPQNTFQIGEPSIIAEQTGIPVIADFRMRDLAAGGEGAPLIPFFDEYFFGNQCLRALQNIGGIANVTVVGKNHPTLAFDTGPGNCLIDWAIRKTSKGHLAFDASGKMASQGQVDRKAVSVMARHPYFKRRPPKSTGKELFNERFIPQNLLKARAEDLVATLTYFTAHTLHESFKRFLPKHIQEIIASGGGALNLTLMKHLRELFWPTPVKTIADYGIPVQAKEPLAFAFFALRAMEGKINHSPSGTGARKACVLGKIIPPSGYAAY